MMGVVHVVRGRARGSGYGIPPVGSRVKTPIGGLEDEVLQKLKQNMKFLYNFLTFSRRKFRI